MTMLIANAMERAHLAGPMSISIAAGEFVGLVGPNGAGKSTLLRALAGLSRGGGSLTLDGEAVGGMPMNRRSRRIAFLPATREVDWPISVADVVALGREPHGDRDAAAITSALQSMDAEAFTARRIDTLSTGERARVLLARVLATRADVLMLDEPTSNLDPGHELSVIEVLKSEAARGAAVMASFHNLFAAERHCSRLVLISDGRIVADGAPSAVLSNANTAHAFGVHRVDGAWQACEGKTRGL